VDFIARFDASLLKPLALERRFVGGAFSEQYSGSSKDSEYTSYTYTSGDSFLAELELELRRSSMHRETPFGIAIDDSKDGFDEMEEELQ
jgi:hypothetical protein